MAADPQRLRQIDTLRQYFPTIKETIRNTSFETPLNLPNHQSITLTIMLPQNFPMMKPTVQTFPKVMHRIVDANSQVKPNSLDCLRRWHPTTSSLGKVVYEIVSEFMREVPQVLDQKPLPYGGGAPSYGQNPRSTLQSSDAGRSASTNRLQVASNVSIPEIDQINPDDIPKLMNDEEAFQRFFEGLECVKSTKRLRDDLGKSNSELAAKNSVRQNDIDTLRRELDQRLDAAEQKRTSFKSQASKQQEIMNQFSTSSLIKKLEDAAMQSEQESDAIGQKFLHGDIDQKEFVRQFMASRKQFHTRSAKKESLMMLLRQQG